MTQQIWKDYYVDLSANLTDGACDYEIRRGADVIFTGRAVAAPDGSCRVRVNDICAGWLVSALPDLTALAFTADGSLQDFALYVGGSKVEDITLYRDWSYDRGFDPYTLGISSAPVRTEVDVRMPILQSRLKSASVTVNVRGSSSTVSVSGAGVIAVPAQNAEGSVTVGGVAYALKETCKRYALYYVNAYGGWDQLLMDSGVETTGWDRSTIKTDYDNNDAEAAGERNWRTGVTRTWSLRTGVLTDDQAAGMHHVTGSVQAYLYDMAEGVVLPVIMTDAAIEERSYRQGRRKIEYTVGCRLAQTEIRR